MIERLQTQIESISEMAEKLAERIDDIREAVEDLKQMMYSLKRTTTRQKKWKRFSTGSRPFFPGRIPNDGSTGISAGATIRQ